MDTFLKACNDYKAIRPIEGNIFMNDTEMIETSGGTGSSKDDEMIMERNDEAKKNRGINCGIKPTAKEIEEHERTHMPFRSWCKHCVRGQAQSTPHYTRDDDENSVPTISWDYMYLNDEDDEEEKRKRERTKEKEEGERKGEQKKKVKKGMNEKSGANSNREAKE